MPDLETQLRVYSHHLEEEFPAVSFEEVVEGLREQSSLLQTLRLRKGLAIAVASAAMVLSLGGGLALLLFQGEEEAPVVTMPDIPPDAFVGDWESIDLDGSLQSMTIERRDVGMYDVEYVDDYATVCEGPATAVGVGTLAGPTTLVVTWEYVCVDGTVVDEIDGVDLGVWHFVHDEAADLLTDMMDVVWFRVGAPSPSIDDADSWTVDTPLGDWTWTWIPHDQGARRLYEEALAEASEPRWPLYPADHEIPPGRVPEVTGMRWEPGFPVDQAETMATRVVVVETRGYLDWAALEWMEMPAPDTPDDLGHHWNRDVSGAFLEIYLDFFEPPFAVLSPSVALDEATVEFHDRETGALAFTLRTLDPDVPAEHLAAGLWTRWDLLVEDGDGLRHVEPPWRRLPVSSVRVASDATGFVAVTVGPGDADTEGRLDVWRSTDGVTWQTLGTSVPVDGTDAWQLVASEDVLLLLIAPEEMQPEMRADLWASSDGATWELVLSTGGTGLGVWVWQTGFGWALTDMSGACHTWLSVDGVGWSRVPFQPEIEVRRHVEAVQCAVLDDEVYIELEEWLGNEEHPVRLGLWIGRLDQ